jgi:hypothetical protein
MGGEAGLICGVGVGTSGRGRKWGKGEGGGTWYKYYIHMYVNGKVRPVETREWWRGEFKYDIFDIL